jgi:superfamily II DNA or RNA helicase
MRQRDIDIRRYKRTWQLEGLPLRSKAFEAITEENCADCILLIGGRRGSNGIGTEWTWTIEVVPPGIEEYEPVYRECASRLSGRETRLIPERNFSMFDELVRQHIPAFGGGATSTFGDMTGHEREEVAQWLLRYLSIEDLRALLDDSQTRQCEQILHLMGSEDEQADAEELAHRVINRFGSELLSDSDRRDLLARRRFPRRTVNYPQVGRWCRGKPAARNFAGMLGLPVVMAGTHYATAPDVEDIEAYPGLGKLHVYQRQLTPQITKTLNATDWNERRAVVWLPTGTGKTRLMVETLLMQTRLEAPRNCILWIANRKELCEQAIEGFRQVWMARGYDSPSADNTGVPTLRFNRLFDNRDWQDPSVFPTVVVASIQTLARRVADDEAYEELLAILGRRCAAVVFDEAHHAIAPSYTRVMRALGLTRSKNCMGENQRTAPPLFGLTATPVRSAQDETERLARRFGGQLLEPSDGYRHINAFIEEGYLSSPQHEVIETGASLNLRGRERETWETFGTIPAGALNRLGDNEARTALILQDLEQRLDQFNSVLVFACSVNHAKTLAEVLSRRGHSAAALYGDTPRPIRWQTIRQFRQRRIKVLVSCDLLTTGFDAPNVDAIVLARPVESRVLYAQMVGRGLRGPRNGGTESCLILDYEDAAGPYADLNELREEFRRDFLGEEVCA